MKEQNISRATIDRLPLYFRTLRLAQDEGIDIISSETLGNRLNITPEQIRKDLTSFGQFGKKGVGYYVNELKRCIGDILGLNNHWNIAVIGIGHLGEALANYQNFASMGFNLVALFDTDKEIIGRVVSHIRVSDMTDLKQIIEEKNISIGVIAVPAQFAQAVADQLVEAGIRGIWNFAPVKMDVPASVQLVNEDLSVGLSRLSYFISSAKENKDVVAITAAMPSGTGLKAFGDVYPDRIFDVGIAEEHAVTMAAGMAAAGAKPVVALYSTFAQRAYDQWVHDVCLQNLPAVLCLDRGGLVGAAGATHHGVFDYSYLRHIPDMVVVAPKDENELRHMLYTAIELNVPVSVRYPRGNGVGTDTTEPLAKLPVGKGEILRQLGKDVVILSIGTMAEKAMEVAELLYSEGIHATVANMRFVKPLDEKLIDDLVKDAKLVVTVEENALAGGFGSAVLEYMSDAGWHNNVLRFGIEDKFIEQGTQKELLELCGLMPEQIADKIKKRIEKNA